VCKGGAAAAAMLLVRVGHRRMCDCQDFTTLRQALLGVYKN
jgi:hypothetical protein